MVTQEIINFIKDQLAQGATKEAIKKILLATGWKAEDIDAAFQQIGGQVPPPPPPFMPVPPQYSNLAESPSKRSRGKLILFLIILLLVLGSGSAGAYYYLFLYPPRILAESISKIPEIKSAGYTLEIKGDASAPAAQQITGAASYNVAITNSGNFDIAQRLWKNTLSFSALSSSAGFAAGLSASLDWLFKNDLYLKLNNFNLAPQQPGPQQNIVAFAGPIAQGLVGKWVKIPQSDIKSQVSERVPGASAEQLQKLKDEIVKANVLTVSKKLQSDTVNDVATHHYQLAINRVALQNLLDILGQQFPDFKEAIPVIASSTQAIESLEVWIGKKDLYPYKLSISGKGDSPQVSGAIAITFSLRDINKSFAAEAPQNAAPIQEILGQFFGGAPSQPIGAPKPAPSALPPPKPLSTTLSLDCAAKGVGGSSGLVGSSIIITATNYKGSEQNIVWSIKNPSIAKLSSLVGKSVTITYLKAGSTELVVIDKTTGCSRVRSIDVI